MRALALLIIASGLLPTIAASQVIEPGGTGGTGPDIVVTADTPLSKEERKAAPPGFSAPGYDPQKTIDVFDAAMRSARCAVTGPIAQPGLLRRVVDGIYNSSAHDQSVDRLMRQTATCGMGRSQLARDGIIEASVSEMGVLFRGAFVIQALRRYAPDLVLTHAELSDPVVIVRLLEREEWRARQRVPSDRTYLKVALCLVQQQPENALKLVGVLDRKDSHRIAARMIEKSRQCVGGARQVRFDPLQFRSYIADAVYRWAVAARNVDSLIPVDGK